MKILILALAALSSTAHARGADIYNCYGDNYRDQIEAALTLSPRARGGRVELDRVDSIYPLGLIHADLGRPETQGGELMFQTGKDAHNGRTAIVRIAADFAAAEKFALSVQTDNRAQAYRLSCTLRE